MPRPEPGAASFLPTLIAHLHDQPFLNTWNFDSTLFSVILIALIVRRGGLIVDVVREDGKTRSRQRVDRVIKVVSAVCPLKLYIYIYKDND